jgi:aryl-alcohol dehydrogenase-like predicted oxidoreductase
VSGVPTIEIAPGYAIPRIITGAWQLSEGHAREPMERAAVFRRFDVLVRHGFTAFDCADIYTGVEELLGSYLQRLSPASRARIQIHTKFVPDRDDLADVDRSYVSRIVDRSLARLGVDRLDLVQFSWWDYDVPGCVEVAGWLAELQGAGKIHLLGATNLDVQRIDEIAAAGIPLVSNQVQYSPLDVRPEHGMAECCARHDAWLLCYGALAGGFLSDRYLGASDFPDEPANRSLTKYGLVIREFGGWDLHQDLLAVLAAVGRKHDVSTSSVALRWLIERPRVAAAIVGVSRRDRVAQNLAAFSFELDDEDRELIASILLRRSGPRGDVFDLERDPSGEHAAIMRYNLNRRE